MATAPILPINFENIPLTTESVEAVANVWRNISGIMPENLVRPLWERFNEAARAVYLANRVGEFLRAVRDTAGDAWTIYPETEVRDSRKRVTGVTPGISVRVTAGRRIPHGWYTVAAHYVPPGEAYAVVTLKGESGRLHPRVPVGAGYNSGPVAFEIVPDFARAFAGWSSLARRAAWAGMAAGACARGLGPVEAQVMADYVQDRGVIDFDDWDADGIPAERFAAALRETDPTGTGSLHPSHAAAYFNRFATLDRAVSGPPDAGNPVG